MSSSWADSRVQILDNCEFMHDKSRDLSIICEKSPSGKYKSTVIRWTSKCREDLLSSEECASILSAYNNLLEKSMVATSLHVKEVGYRVSMDKLEDNFSDDSTDVSSVSSAEGDDAEQSDCTSDEELVVPQLSAKRAGAASLTDSRSSQRSVDAQAQLTRTAKTNGSRREPRDFNPALRRGPVPKYPTQFARPLTTGPPPPPPVPPYYLRPLGSPRSPFDSTTSHESSSGAGVPRMPPIRSALPGFPPDYRPMIPFHSRAYEVRLDIKLLSHGQSYALEQSRPLLSALKETTLRHVLGNLRDFGDAGVLSQKLSNPSHVLQATVNRAYVDSKAYNMTNLKTDDLSKLFRVVGQHDMPRFEVTVEIVCPPAPTQPSSPSHTSVPAIAPPSPTTTTAAPGHMPRVSV